MQTDNKDRNILIHVVNYCGELEQTVERFGTAPTYLQRIKSIAMPSPCASYK